MSNLRVTLVQTDLQWEDKKANMRRLEEKISSLQDKTGIVVLPEMFTTGFTMENEKLAEDMEGPTIQWMKRIAATHRIILTGSMIAVEDGNYYNRLVWMLPDGHFGYYDKRHLFAYAGEDECYTPGTKRLIASVNGWRIHLLICYDLRFPVWSRQSPSGQRGTPGWVDPEYDLLLYVANWPERRILAWKTLLAARAIENQCYVIGLNRTGTDGNGIYYSGDSMAIDPLGTTLYHQSEKEDMHSLLLDKDHLEAIRKKFPFWKDADSFDIIL
jgi:predicted amidohydrolase